MMVPFAKHFPWDVLLFKLIINNVNDVSPGLGLGFFWGSIFLTNHLVTLWAWGLVRLLETIEVHSGYYLPYLNLFHLVPGYAGKYLMYWLQLIN